MALKVVSTAKDSQRLTVGLLSRRASDGIRDRRHVAYEARADTFIGRTLRESTARRLFGGKAVCMRLGGRPNFGHRQREPRIFRASQLAPDGRPANLHAVGVAPRASLRQ